MFSKESLRSGPLFYKAKFFVTDKCEPVAVLAFPSSLLTDLVKNKVRSIKAFSNYPLSQRDVERGLEDL